MKNNVKTETAEQKKYANKLDALQAEIKETRAKLNKANRKARNSRLIAVGILIEYAFEKLNNSQKTVILDIFKNGDPKLAQKALELIGVNLNSVEKTQPPISHAKKAPDFDSFKFTPDTDEI